MGQCAHCGQAYVAPVPVGMEPGTPFGASIKSLATYLRYTHAISYERLAGLLGQVFGLSISEGALANLFHGVKARLSHRVAGSSPACRAACSAVMRRTRQR